MINGAAPSTSGSGAAGGGGAPPVPPRYQQVRCARSGAGPGDPRSGVGRGRERPQLRQWERGYNEWDGGKKNKGLVSSCPESLLGHYLPRGENLRSSGAVSAEQRRAKPQSHAAAHRAVPSACPPLFICPLPPLPFAPRRFLFAAHHHQPLSFLSPSPTERTPLHAPRSDERSRSLPFSPPNPALGAARRRVPNPQRCAKEVPPPFLRVVFFSSSFARG